MFRVLLSRLQRPGRDGYHIIFRTGEGAWDMVRYGPFGSELEAALCLADGDRYVIIRSERGALVEILGDDLEVLNCAPFHLACAIASKFRLSIAPGLVETLA